MAHCLSMSADSWEADRSAVQHPTAFGRFFMRAATTGRRSKGWWCSEFSFRDHPLPHSARSAGSTMTTRPAAHLGARQGPGPRQGPGAGAERAARPVFPALAGCGRGWGRWPAHRPKNPPSAGARNRASPHLLQSFSPPLGRADSPFHSRAAQPGRPAARAPWLQPCRGFAEQSIAPPSGAIRAP